MKAIYFLVSSSSWYKENPLKVFTEYFEKQGGFTDAFLMAAIVAAVVCVLYYVICRFSFSWSKVGTWLVALVLTGCISFAATGMQTGIHKGDRGALPHVLQEQVKKQKKAGLSDSQKSKINKDQAKLKREFAKPYFVSAPVDMLCYSNVVYSMILFYIFSLVINGASRYGVYIPHRGFFSPKRN